MVAKATLPGAITTQEQLVMWSIMALDESNPKGAVLERPNLVSFYVEWQLVKSPDGQDLFVGRVVLPINGFSTLAAGSKPWLAAKELPQGAAISAYYSSN